MSQSKTRLGRDLARPGGWRLRGLRPVRAAVQAEGGRDTRRSGGGGSTGRAGLVTKPQAEEFSVATKNNIHAGGGRNRPERMRQGRGRRHARSHTAREGQHPRGVADSGRAGGEKDADCSRFGCGETGATRFGGARAMSYPSPVARRRWPLRVYLLSVIRCLVSVVRYPLSVVDGPSVKRKSVWLQTANCKLQTGDG